MPTDVLQPTIFLSYAHHDRVKAQRLAAALDRAGYTVWWDGLIEGGAQFDKSIRDALEAADAVVVLWSKHRSNRTGCGTRPRRAATRRLVPLSLDGSAPPLGFRQYQMIDVSGWRGKAGAPELDAIRRAIATAVGQEPPVPARRCQPDQPERSTAYRRGRRRGPSRWRRPGRMGDGLLGPGQAQAASIAVLPFKNSAAIRGRPSSPTA